MAIYSFNVKNVTRSNERTGTNACASAAYISGLRIHCDRNGKTYQYGHKERILYTNTTMPEGAPEAWRDPTVFWNEVENNEKPANARLAKVFIAAMPNELTRKQQIAVCDAFSLFLAGKRIGSSCGLHTKSDGPIPAEEKPDNDHVHFLLANRLIGPDGKWQAKKKQEYARDEAGERIPRIDPATGEQKVDAHGRKQWVRHSVESNPLDRKELVEECRQKWAELCNQYLDEEHKIDHRSNAERGIEQIPTIHEGYIARKIEAEGGVSELCEYNRQVRADNAEIKQLDGEINFLKDTLSELIAQLRGSVKHLTAKLISAFEYSRDAVLGRTEQMQPEGEQAQTDPPIPEVWLTDGNDHHRWHTFDGNYDYQNDTDAIVFVKSDDPLIKQIIDSPGADQFRNLNYETDEESIQNICDMLQVMTNTVCYLQRNGLQSRDQVRGRYMDLSNQLMDNLDAYKAIEKHLSVTDRKITMRDQFDAYKAIYKEYSSMVNATNPLTKRKAKKYREDHNFEIGQYESARKFLRENSPTGKMQSKKALLQEKESLQANLQKAKDDFNTVRSRIDSLGTICDSLDYLIGPDTDAPGWQATDPIRSTRLPSGLRRSMRQPIIKPHRKREHEQPHRSVDQDRTEPEIG